MTRPHISEALEKLAERSVPREVDLWSAIRAQLQSTKGRLDMNAMIHRTRLRWLTGVAATLLLGAVMVVATPQGRAWAQNVWRFFTQAQSNSFPVPVVSTPDTLAPTAAPPAGLAGCEGLAGSDSLACQAAQVEAMLGFDLKLPAGPLAGLEFVYAQINADQQTATFVYNAVGGGSYLSLTQGKRALDSVIWETVPPEATVERVMVGGQVGEYVRGMFVVLANSAEAIWSADAPVQRLRWREGDTQYEVSLEGEVQVVEYLDRDGLIALAESLR